MTLEQFRISSSLTYAALAERLGVVGVNASRTAQRWAKHERIPSRSTMAAIADATGGKVLPADWPLTTAQAAA